MQETLMESKEDCATDELASASMLSPVNQKDSLGEIATEEHLTPILEAM